MDSTKRTLDTRHNVQHTRVAYMNKTQGHKITRVVNIARVVCSIIDNGHYNVL